MNRISKFFFQWEKIKIVKFSFKVKNHSIFFLFLKNIRNVNIENEKGSNGKCLLNAVDNLIFYFSDPRQWSETAVMHWLDWAIREFSLAGVAMQPWQHMTGKQICAMGKESFLARAPAFMGDILWEHLEMLQKGM